jgi:ubiquinone/menaquinone biosynthesis C-methylase UbiE
MSVKSDQAEFKQAMTNQWNSAASGWNASSAVIRPWLLSSTQAMLKTAGINTGSRVLDVAAGAGDQTLDIAVLTGPSGSVMATDISPDILEFAKENAIRAGFANVETSIADGEKLPFDDGGFDAAVCRLGLMFFPDPLQGLREIHRVLKPGARLCTLVFSSPDKNPCLTILMSTALKHAGLPPADPYRAGTLMSLGKPGQLEAMFSQAGFTDCVTTRVSAPFPLGSARAYLDFVRSSAAPVLQILGRLDEPARDKAWAEMDEKLSSFNDASGWTGPNELLLTSGVK